MTLLACMPVTGCFTLAEVAACSLTAADNTYKLDDNVNVVFEDNGGNDILILYEADRGVQALGHAAVGPDAVVDLLPVSGLAFTRTVLAVSDENMSVADNQYAAGIAVNIKANPAVDTPNALYFGGFIGVDSAGTNDLLQIAGIYGYAQHIGTGNLATLTGLAYFAWAYERAEVTQGIYIEAWAADGDSVIGIAAYAYPDSVDTEVVGVSINATTGAGPSAYGIKMEDVTGATANYGIKTGLGQNELGDRLTVNQNSTIAAIPTLKLKQADLSEEFIRFDTTVGVGNPIDTAALGAYYGKVRVYVEGVGAKWIALYN